MTDLIHITSPERALNIISKGAYITDNNPGHYDAGMNFLGVLGEYPNTQPTRGAKVHFKWHGKVSNPLPYDAYKYHDPNILFDFNGSGHHHPNNDPRYFLPYQSTGLVVKKIELEREYNEEALIEWWLQFKGKLYVFFHDFRILKPYLLKKALEHLQEVNYKLTNEEVTISIKWGR
tara:strand:+ start:1022 stop:1549 length:528 start_codon:yes stop_codon:yes gene_type:complete